MNRLMIVSLLGIATALGGCVNPPPKPNDPYYAPVLPRTPLPAAQNNGAGDGTGGYGYQWWVRSFGEGGYDTYYAFGAWGQYVFVVPELDLVTVIASHYPQNSYAPRPFFTDYILSAYMG